MFSFDFFVSLKRPNSRFWSVHQIKRQRHSKFVYNSELDSKFSSSIFVVTYNDILSLHIPIRKFYHNFRVTFTEFEFINRLFSPISTHSHYSENKIKYKDSIIQLLDISLFYFFTWWECWINWKLLLVWIVNNGNNGLFETSLQINFITQIVILSVRDRIDKWNDWNFQQL